MWVITDESRHRFLSATQQRAAAKILLDPNGTFVSSQIPEDFLYGPPEAGTQLVSGTGNWTLISGGGKQQIQLDFETIHASQPGAVPRGTQLDVAKGRIVTLFYFQGGDADQGRKIQFVKK